MLPQYSKLKRDKRGTAPPKTDIRHSVCIVGILRITSLFELINDDDPTWNLVSGFVWWYVIGYPVLE
jgi:hypothetical protein